MKTFKFISALVGLVAWLAAGYAHAAPNALQWGIDRTVSPPSPCAFLTSTNCQTGTVVLPFTAVGAGAVARPLNVKLGELPSITDYGAKCDNVTDDGPAIQAALNANRIVTVPSNAGSNYCIVNTGVTVGAGKSIIGLTGQGNNVNGTANCFFTNSTIDMFTVTGVGVTFEGICAVHNGTNGRVINVAAGSGGFFSLLYSNIQGASDTSPADLVISQTSANVIRGNEFGNSRPNAFALDFLAPADATQISNRIEFNTFTASPNTVGPPVVMHSGKGIQLAGSATAGHLSRQEGPMVMGNQFISQNINLSLGAVLSGHVIGNEFDQAWTLNVVLQPQSSFAVSDISFDGNWISTPLQQTTGVCVSEFGTNPVGNLTFTGNHFSFCGFGLALTSAASGVTVTGNNFSAMGSAIQLTGTKNVVITGNTCAGCTSNLNIDDSSGTGGPFVLGANIWDSAGTVTFTMGNPLLFSFSPQNIGKHLATDYAAATGTLAATGCVTIAVPHGLAGTPNIDKVRVSGRVATGAMTNLTTQIVSVDVTNINTSACATVTTTGTIRVSAGASL